MTKKLYYLDAYIKSFSATVISSEKAGDFYNVILDQTAFFPEEGGQAADKGKIASSRVLDVKENDGVIIHITDAPLDAGTVVECEIDFAERYEKMKCFFFSGSIWNNEQNRRTKRCAKMLIQYLQNSCSEHMYRSIASTSLIA